MSKKILIICGATGSGKSSLAIEVAKKLNTEIISADSLAIYKELDIGTAKPTKEEQSIVKHHLIDVVSPFETFSVSDYESLALPIIDKLLSENKTPIICGGTGFYINSILYKLSYGGIPENLEVRNKFFELSKTEGVEAVHNELKKVDEESAKKLHPNDLVRVIRALEIYYGTGKKKSEQQDKLIPRYDYTAVTINHDREVLYSRINKRVDIMLENGLINEVKGLIDKGVTIDNQCMQGIGYKEVYDAIINDNFDNLKDLLKLNSRHYAKRQITFFKKLENLQYLNGNLEELTNKTIELLNK
ncbi:MAG: tRNA (adenosine(37)-N6)-dimethylallyltransferase MiaA [Clostridia bacterium]|nr:tRNA (adenosine(37)-N6)-dimethylallyltransferase MiaA [Clostridia bacterium]